VARRGWAYDRPVQSTVAAIELPIGLRVCRSLVWTQAAFVVLAGVFVILTSVIFGSGNAIPFHGETLSGARASALGAVYVAAGALLAYLGYQLGRRAPWARVAVVSMQVFLAVVLVYRSLDLSLSTVINVVLFVAIVGLLFSADVRRAFQGHAGT
jgi:hypothetical protein